MSSPDRVLGHYQVGAEIGAGGMGRVCRGTDLRDGTAVAIKFLRPTLVDASFRERFEREAHVAALLRSPYTVHLLDYGMSGGTPCIVMEFVEGESVGAALRRGPFGPRRAARTARDAARALEEARARGVVHRDIKPDNILITADGMARVADFGIARQVADDGLTSPGAYVGTAAYSAPEQFLGEADHRSDLFALGATLYAMLKGVAPFGPTGTRALAAGRTPAVDYGAIPDPLANIVRRCLERDPRDRYQSADELAGALERAVAFLPEEPVAASPGGASTVVSPPTAVATMPQPALAGTSVAPAGALPAAATRRNQRVLLAVAGVALLALAGGAAVFAMSRGGDSQANVLASARQTATPSASPSVAASPTGSPVLAQASGAATVPATAAAPGTAQAAAPTAAPPTARPAAPTPTPAPANTTRFASGEWDDNFTVISTNAACNNDPQVGALIQYSYLYEEVGDTADGFIDDGETVKVSRLGELALGDFVFHWPQLNYEYDIDGGHATFSQRFLTSETGTAALTETYDDGCVVVMRDDG